jgi:hypothetical protein
MPKYRAFVLDDQGRVLGPKLIEATDDDVAMEKARSLGNGHDVEVGGRAIPY